MRQTLEQRHARGECLMSNVIQPKHVIGVGIDMIEVSRIARMIE